MVREAIYAENRLKAGDQHYERPNSSIKLQNHCENLSQMRFAERCSSIWSVSLPVTSLLNPAVLRLCDGGQCQLAF